MVNLGHASSESDVFLSPFLARKIKPHQIEGLQFMWKSTIMITNAISEHEDPIRAYAGCILAHAMGLGTIF